MVKRIIDPSQTDLLILNKKRNDFIINLAHNYYNAYDNVRKIPEWLSSDICAATTGAAFSTRTLYTTEFDYILDRSHIVMLIFVLTLY
jgi:hypothetical protein